MLRVKVPRVIHHDRVDDPPFLKGVQCNASAGTIWMNPSPLIVHVKPPPYIIAMTIT